MKAYKYEAIMKDETKLALLEQSIFHINESLSRIEKRFDRVENKIDGLDKVVQTKFEIVNFKIEDVRKSSWSQFRWIMGSLLALFVTLVTALIKGHIS